jgi:predicted ester cyclase
MSTDDNKKAARRMTEETWNHGNMDVIDEICDPSYTMHGGGGTAELKQAIEEFRRGFPDGSMTIEEMVAEGETVVLRWTGQGTHLGEYQGVAPTGKRITTTGISIYHFANGKLVEDFWESGSTDIRALLLDPQS